MSRQLNIHLVMIFALTTSVTSAQETSDTLKIDTVRNRYLPTGLRIGTDALAIVKSNVQDNFSGWEVNADIDLYRYFLAFDYGKWSRAFNASDSAIYNNEGRYWRAGLDVNFLLKDAERNMFFIGARYGRSVFSEDLALISVDPVWGTLTNNYASDNVHARWFEVTTGIKVRMWKMIWMGYTARFKFGLKTSGEGGMMPHDIPGYGRTDKDTYWGFNYQIFIRIPFRPLPPLPPPRKK